MFTRRRFMSVAASLAAPAVVPSSAFADWPTRPVRIVVPFSPGGSTDSVARIVGNRLSEMWGQPVLIENRGGAGGNIAAETVAKSDADGCTILIVGPGQATNQFLYSSLSYDPVADFAPISLLIVQPNVMTVPNISPVRSVKEFIAYCNSTEKKGRIVYGSSGVGTTLHLSAELFKYLAHVEMTHVPYRGGGPAMNDLIGGRLDVIFNNAPSILPNIRAGQARGLAVTTRERARAAPELPTLAESGVPGFDVSSWFAFFVPARTPRDIVDKLNVDTVDALDHDTVKPKLESLGADPKSSTPAELAAFLQAEIDKWGPVIRLANIKAE